MAFPVGTSSLMQELWPEWRAGGEGELFFGSCSPSSRPPGKDREMKATYGLEYALFFGVPDNKLELIHGNSRWAFPFLSRAEAETHFQQWLETFRRWKKVDTPTPIRKSEGTWQTEVSGIRMQLFPRPIEIHIPIACQAFD